MTGFCCSGIQWTLSNYGGYGLAGSNIVLPNGSIDPWHFLGVLSDLSPTVQAVFITGTAHCAGQFAIELCSPPLRPPLFQPLTHSSQWLVVGTQICIRPAPMTVCSCSRRVKLWALTSKNGSRLLASTPPMLRAHRLVTALTRANRKEVCCSRSSISIV